MCPAGRLVRLKTRAIRGFLYHLSMQAQTSAAGTRHSFRAYDPRLEPIAAKVAAGERLSAEDGLALYRTQDVLAVGWLANPSANACMAT